MLTPLHTILKNIPQQHQRQDSTTGQLADLAVFANRLGLYDAADYIRTSLALAKSGSLIPARAAKIEKNLT